MKPLNDSHQWPKLAVFDIEAKKWINVFLLCHVDELGNRVHFATIKEYLEWLFSPAFQSDHVWAHWGGRYDHRFIIAEATNLGWQWETIQSGGLIIIVSVFHPSGREIRFCESARLMPDSVEKIGKTVGLPKLDADRSHMENMSFSEALEYCFRDCDIVLKGLQYMKSALTAVNADFAYTLASIATRWVRRSGIVDWKRFYERKQGRLVYRQDISEADEWCFPAFQGGRVEIFRASRLMPNRVFKGPLYYYDFRSSYPWSMQFDLPCYFEGYKAPNERTERALETCGISEATVTVPSDTYLPVLGIRHQGRLVFPVGTMRGKWTNIELLEAYRAGAKVEIHAQARYRAKSFLFPFVKTFYKLRQDAIAAGDEFRSYAYKIALNSLYGKLTETVERSSTLFGPDRMREAINAGKTVTPTPTPGVYAVTHESVGPFRLVAAGCYVTARSRLLLYRALQKCLALGGRIFYCDTDSIITDVLLPEEPEALGNLKLEHTFQEMEIVSPKVYRGITVQGKKIIKAKGVPVKSEEKDPKKADEEMERKWSAFTKGYYENVPKKQWKTEAPGIWKDGVRGFKSDINKGSVGPTVAEMTRALRSGDKKRSHDKSNSSPLRVSI